jgi:hypothetical protein
VTVQLDLFAPHPDERLFRYWRQRLSEWPREVMESRHQLDSSGWSMATQGLKFAVWLFKARQMHPLEFRRWCRFNRRVRRRDHFNNQPTKTNNT